MANTSPPRITSTLVGRVDDPRGLIDLSITGTVDRPQRFRGKAATFTITVSNLGPSTATSVLVDDEWCPSDLATT